PGRAALRAPPAVRQPVLDGHSRRADRDDHGLGVLRDPGLRAGALAGPGGSGRGDVLRLLVRPRRPRRRRPRQARRPHQHHDGLPPLPVPVVARTPYRVSSSSSWRVAALSYLARRCAPLTLVLSLAEVSW